MFLRRYPKYFAFILNPTGGITFKNDIGSDIINCAERALRPDILFTNAMCVTCETWTDTCPTHIPAIIFIDHSDHPHIKRLPRKSCYISIFVHSRTPQYNNNKISVFTLYLLIAAMTDSVQGARSDIDPESDDHDDYLGEFKSMVVNKMRNSIDRSLINDPDCIKGRKKTVQVCVCLYWGWGGGGNLG